MRVFSLTPPNPKPHNPFKFPDIENFVFNWLRPNRNKAVVMATLAMTLVSLISGENVVADLTAYRAWQISHRRRLELWNHLIFFDVHLNLNQEEDFKTSAVFVVKRQAFFVVISGLTINDAIPSPMVISGSQLILRIKAIINVLPKLEKITINIIARLNCNEQVSGTVSERQNWTRGLPRKANGRQSSAFAKSFGTASRHTNESEVQSL